ncbi:MAG: hypothetical protein AAF539_05590 [Planctomycetota bacterium]
MTESPSRSDVSGNDKSADDQPVSCLPAMVAATLLMSMVAFILCAGSTYYLFQQRTAFAIRTLEGYREVIEQSYLTPEEKADVVKQIDEVQKRMQVDDFPPAKASAVMERLVRLPISQWGELVVIESVVDREYQGEVQTRAKWELRRLRTAIAQDNVTVVDVNHVLEPVTQPDSASPLGRTLKQPVSVAGVGEVIERAGLIADRAKIQEEPAEPPSISQILKTQLQAADVQGGY